MFEIPVCSSSWTVERSREAALGSNLLGGRLGCTSLLVWIALADSFKKPNCVWDHTFCLDCGPPRVLQSTGTVTGVCWLCGRVRSGTLCQTHTPFRSSSCTDSAISGVFNDICVSGLVCRATPRAPALKKRKIIIPGTRTAFRHQVRSVFDCFWGRGEVFFCTRCATRVPRRDLPHGVLGL